MSLRPQRGGVGARGGGVARHGRGIRQGDRAGHVLGSPGRGVGGRLSLRRARACALARGVDPDGDDADGADPYKKLRRRLGVRARAPRPSRTRGPGAWLSGSLDAAPDGARRSRSRARDERGERLGGEDVAPRRKRGRRPPRGGGDVIFFFNFRKEFVLEEGRIRSTLRGPADGLFSMTPSRVSARGSTSDARAYRIRRSPSHSSRSLLKAGASVLGVSEARAGSSSRPAWPSAAPFGSPTPPARRATPSRAPPCSAPPPPASARCPRRRTRRSGPSGRAPRTSPRSSACPAPRSSRPTPCPRWLPVATGTALSGGGRARASAGPARGGRARAPRGGRGERRRVHRAADVLPRHVPHHQHHQREDERRGGGHRVERRVVAEGVTIAALDVAGRVLRAVLGLLLLLLGRHPSWDAGWTVAAG